MPTILKRILTSIIVLLMLLVLSALVSDEGLFGFGISSYTSRILIFCCINIILAVSLNLINGFTGQFSIGHAGFMAIGAYSSAYFTVYYGTRWAESLSKSIGDTAAGTIILLIAVVIGMLTGALAGLIVGIPSLRLRGDYLAIVTLGFAEIIRIVILNIDAVGGATGFAVPGLVNFFWVGLFAVITVVVVHNIVRSSTGRVLISIREDELAAEAMGINSTRYKVLSFSISSAFAALAGVLFGHYTQFLSTNDFLFIRSFEIIIMIVLGGMGSLSGSILGAVVITVLPELLREFMEWRLVIYSALLIFIMLTRPQGILGHHELGTAWLRRSQKGRLGDKPVGARSGLPITSGTDADEGTQK
jgi:branched-chain amino acid transport system permease protein